MKPSKIAERAQLRIARFAAPEGLRFTAAAPARAIDHRVELTLGMGILDGGITADRAPGSLPGSPLAGAGSDPGDQWNMPQRAAAIALPEPQVGTAERIASLPARSARPASPAGCVRLAGQRR